MKYEKIIKWVLAILFFVGIAVSVYGFIVGWPTDEQKWDTSLHFPVDLILFGAYTFVGIAILAVVLGVFVIGGLNNPKTLLKLLVGVVAIAVIVGGAWMLAPGSLPIGYMGDPATDFELKLTDTMLSLTYLTLGAAFISLIVGWVVGATRK